MPTDALQAPSLAVLCLYSFKGSWLLKDISSKPPRARQTRLEYAAHGERNWSLVPNGVPLRGVGRCRKNEQFDIYDQATASGLGTRSTAQAGMGVNGYIYDKDVKSPIMGGEHPFRSKVTIGIVMCTFIPTRTRARVVSNEVNGTIFDNGQTLSHGCYNLYRESIWEFNGEI
ncbi:hypothetical protein BDZ97DRAFT_2001576 [Flammula alnicola]|nr:hypothetical protein BDZ97DRAFT_2001576 [Flammula alnicola]